MGDIPYKVDFADMATEQLLNEINGIAKHVCNIMDLIKMAITIKKYQKCMKKSQ